jgi:hypothetical protein
VKHLTMFAVAAAALTLAACADSGGSNGKASRKDFEDAQLKFAQCMRQHGIDMDDPKNGRLRVGDERPRGARNSGGKRATGPSPKFKRAQQACKKYLDAAGRPPELSDEDKAEFERAALAFARCMREHGINMPDPKFTGNGIAQSLPPGVNPDGPRFRRAETACEDKLPNKDKLAGEKSP